MANRKRSIVLRCPVTAEERQLIEQKMALLTTRQIGAYHRKMAI
ncbi:MAG: plasmid mobilization relaxosome protein MobC, partial [Candidatus Riflebacteria bacterium]|nr:plasmid mobilization relaxosome protein MobC [Candidatus Riflebacteria bacterium]